jgi:hypothetical protein
LIGLGFRHNYTVILRLFAFQINIMSRFCQDLISRTVLTLLFLVPNLRAESGADSSQSFARWVFFTDKVSESPIAISEKAMERRFKRASLTDNSWYDLPVNEQYIQALRAAGANIRTISRWLNAVSIVADYTALSEIEFLPFVDRIYPLSSYRLPLPQQSSAIRSPLDKSTIIDYGPSGLQVAMLGADSLHNMGLTGYRIRIGIMDTGFNTNHPVFSRMVSENLILMTHDFINGDSNVIDQPDIQQLHGTAVLSVLAGFDEGSLIGPAFGAEIVLAKTEIVTQEIRAEEDYWVAASEWMESLGVEIISSSVGYTDWYDTLQLDGHTPIVTQAANIANLLGIVVVNAAGNEALTSWHKIIPPADGDSVIAAGAVDPDMFMADFSSRGPTADGRIKPNFCALGVDDYVAFYTGGYGFSSGTSFSAPLIAGGIALLLEGHPAWRLADIFGNLKRASSKSLRPNNSYGWGVPDLIDAYYQLPYEPVNQLSMYIAPHPAVDSVVFYLIIPGPGLTVLSVHDVAGVKIEQWEFRTERPEAIRSVWNGRSRSNMKVASGIYICNLKMGDAVFRQKLFYIAE